MKITTLKKIRKEKGITQEELAKMANISVMTYYRYETNERLPDVHTAQKFANILNTTVEDLFPLPSDKTSPSKK